MDQPKETPGLKYASVAISGRREQEEARFLKSSSVPGTIRMGIFPGGDWSRKFSIEQGKHNPNDPKHHLATDYGDDVDHQIDQALREKMSHPESHMAVELDCRMECQGTDACP